MASSLIGALALNEFAKTYFEHHYPDNDVVAKGVYAIVALVFAVIVCAHISKAGDKYETDKKLNQFNGCKHCAILHKYLHKEDNDEPDE